MNKRYIIVANGQNDFSKIYKKEEGDIIVGCDGGYRHLLNMGLKVDIWVGDYDSLSMITVESSEKYSFNPIKDDSDVKLAVNICLEKQKMNNESCPILLYNVTGGRKDHFIAVVRLLEEIKNENLMIVDAHNLIYIKNGDFEVTKNGYKYISFYNTEEGTYLTLKKFKYELNDYYMHKFDYLCLSNEIIGKGIVKTNKPILVIQSNDLA